MNSPTITMERNSATTILEERNRLVAEKVFGINLSAESPEDYANAVMSGFSMSNGHGGLSFSFGHYPNRINFDVVCPESKWGHEGTEGNSGYGLWLWQNRHKKLRADHRAALENHVAAWRRDVPRYLTDIAADYSVLCHVRDNWSIGEVQKFREALRTRESEWQDGRVFGDGMGYRVGDYSLAALATLGALPAPW